VKFAGDRPDPEEAAALVEVARRVVESPAP
jgi:hypothetical protein